MSTVWIKRDIACKDCGFPVITVCCNGTMVTHKDAGDFDYWSYCANKGCVNHEGSGEGSGQTKEHDWEIFSKERV